MATLILILVISLATVESINPNSIEFQWVSDPNRLLTTKTLSTVQVWLNHSRTIPMNCAGVPLPYQLAMVIVDHIDDGWSLSMFSQTLMNNWKVGYTSCDNGIIGLLVMRPPATFVLAGVGAQVAYSVNLNSTWDELNQNRSDAAMLQMAFGLLEALNAQPTNSTNFLFVGLMFFLICLIVAFIHHCHQRSKISESESYIQ